MKLIVSLLMTLVGINSAFASASNCSSVFTQAIAQHAAIAYSEADVRALEELRMSEIVPAAVEAQMLARLQRMGVANAAAVARALMSFENNQLSVRDVIAKFSSGGDAPAKANVVHLAPREDLANLVMRTERLEIRAMGRDKTKDAVSVWGNPETQRMSGDYVDEGTASYLLAMGQSTLAEAQAKSGPYMNFGIYKDGELVGMSQVATGQEHTIFGLGKGRPSEKWMSISYHLKPTAWGKGIASEAATRLVQFAFETMHVDGLHGEAIDGNIGSQNVLRKLGFEEFMHAAGLPHGAVHFYINRAMYEAKHAQAGKAAGF